MTSVLCSLQTLLLLYCMSKKSCPRSIVQEILSKKSCPRSLVQEVLSKKSCPRSLVHEVLSMKSFPRSYAQSSEYTHYILTNLKFRVDQETFAAWQCIFSYLECSRLFSLLIINNEVIQDFDFLSLKQHYL